MFDGQIQEQNKHFNYLGNYIVYGSDRDVLASKQVNLRRPVTLSTEH